MNHNTSESESTDKVHLSRLISLGALVSSVAILFLIGVDVVAIAATRGPTPRQPKTVVVHASDSSPVRAVVYLSVAPAIKPGPDGQLHDAWSQTSFDLHVGKPVKLVINNTDNVPHSITAPGAGVNIIAVPGKHTYTMLVSKAGVFQWYCIYPCDPWSMQHDGYMRGTIVVS